MTHRRVVGIPLAAVLAFCFAAAPATQPFRPDVIRHGNATMKLIQDRFYQPKRHAYLQEIRSPDGKPSNGTADAWTLGIQLTAITAATRVDRSQYLSGLRRFVDELDAYWITLNGIGGYNSTIHPRSPDRYYDDNAWFVLGLVEAYELTHDPEDLERAKATLRYVLSGEDTTLGGGLWWQENKKQSKNTCGNAPGICGAVRVFKYSKDPAVLKTAVRLYDWTQKNLQDTDGLYFDNINTERKIGRAKFTYNSALMMRAACLLYDQTRDAKYLKEAERVAAAADAKWVRSDTGVIAGPAYFAHLLAEAFLEVSDRDHDPRWRKLDHAAVAYIWDHNRDTDGLFPERWSDTKPLTTSKARLINQASAARAFFRAAWPEN